MEQVSKKPGLTLLELEEDARNRASDRWGDMLLCSDWDKCIAESWEDKCAKFGFDFIPPGVWAEGGEMPIVHMKGSFSPEKAVETSLEDFYFMLRLQAQYKYLQKAATEGWNISVSFALDNDMYSVGAECVYMQNGDAPPSEWLWLHRTATFFVRTMLDLLYNELTAGYWRRFNSEEAERELERRNI